MRIGIAHATRSSARALELSLTRDGQHQVVWTVEHGRQAIAKVAEQKPDLLLLDACIADSTSTDVTRRIMQKTPCAIVIIVDQLQTRAELIYEAMGLGALDVVACPTMQGTGTPVGDKPLLAKVLTVSRILGLTSRPVSGRVKTRGTGGQKLVAIGASTGGPQALATVLKDLPRELNASVILVQHVDSEFSSGLATWLQQGTSMRVALATPGVFPTAGTAWLAATNDHLVMTGDRSLSYTPHPRDIPYRPSVDALFRSLAEHWPTPGVAVLLTGMGRDGARGMKQLREAGWHTIAQDEASSVVFGMPKAAIDIGAADEVVALPGMAAAIIEACG